MKHTPIPHRPPGCLGACRRPDEDKRPRRNQALETFVFNRGWLNSEKIAVSQRDCISEPCAPTPYSAAAVFGLRTIRSVVAWTSKAPNVAAAKATGRLVRARQRLST
jgi:hypothetical protein